MIWLRRVLLILMLIIGSWLVLAWSHVLPQLSARQQAALALMRAHDPPPLAGTDGFADAWALRLVVPRAERAALLAADVARINAAPLDTPALSSPAVYPERVLPTPEELAPLCRGKVQGAECLAHLRRHQQAAAEVVAHHQELIAELDRIFRADRLHSPFVPSLERSEAQQAGIGLQFDLLRFNAAALQHLAGDSTRAQQALCADIRDLRRLRSANALQMFDQFGLALVHTRLQLLQAIQDELTSGASLPESCAPALAAMTDVELDGCPAARNQFQAIESMYVHQENQGQLYDEDAPVWLAWSFLLLWEREHTLALYALQSEPFCRVRSGPDLRDPSLGAFRPVECGAVELLFNGLGCLTAVVNLNQDRYHRRRLELDQSLAQVRERLMP